jgi:AcrR family transcriptional regulator
VASKRGDGKERRGLPRGPQALPREEVVADQRRRLFDAIVELINEHGLQGVRISELVSRAGVSRRSFYEHFHNKEECLLAAFDASVQRLTEAMARAYDPEMQWRTQVEAIVRALFDATIARPSATRLVCVDVIAAGEEGVERWAHGTRRFERFLGEVFKQAPGEGGIPEPVAKAVVGALRKILYSRVSSGQSGRALRSELDRVLPEVVEWICSYYPSPASIPMRPRQMRVPSKDRANRPTRGGRRGGRAPGSLVTLARLGPRGLPSGEHNLPRGFVEHNQRERIFDAIANLTAAHGYPALSLEDVAAEAAVSLQTFYSHFDSKEEAFIATYEVGHARAVGACMEAFAAEQTWAEGMRAAVAAMLEFLAAEPSYAHAACVDIVVSVPRLTERVEQTRSSYAEILATRLSSSNGATGASSASPIVGEAVVGGVVELLHDYVARGLTERLPELAEHATYIALTPFLGSEAAAAAVAAPRDAPRGRAHARA